MANTFKIIRDNNTVDALIKAFQDNKEDIKDVFCAIRFADGGLLLIDQDVPFETLCTISKKLDLIIDNRQLDTEFEIDIEDNDEDEN